MVIDPMENSAFLERTYAGDFDMFIGSWGCVTGDADYGLYAMFHTEAHGSPWECILPVFVCSESYNHFTA